MVAARPHEYGDPRLPARFWAKVRVDPDTGCWLWGAAMHPSGYGCISWNGHAALAHRVSYMALVGNIPIPLEIDHLCRRRGCVNPTHLEPVTRQVNMLRGEGVSGLNAVKTHCPQGHEYTSANTIITRNSRGKPGRKCRTCVNKRKMDDYFRKHPPGSGPGSNCKQRNTTHCPQGHPYDEQNTKWHNNKRTCRTCARESMRRSKAAKLSQDRSA